MSAIVTRRCALVRPAAEGAGPIRDRRSAIGYLWGGTLGRASPGTIRSVIGGANSGRIVLLDVTIRPEFDSLRAFTLESVVRNRTFASEWQPCEG